MRHEGRSQHRVSSARLVLAPLTLGEQGPLQAAGVPAVLVQVSGEAGPTASEPVSEAGLAGVGKGVLSALYALDRGPAVGESAEGPVQLGFPAQRKLIPEWAFDSCLGCSCWRRS